MRRTERATAFGKAIGGLLGEGRLSETVVLGLSAVALQAAVLDRPVLRLGSAEEAQVQSDADSESGDAVSVRRRSPTIAHPPLWCAPAEAAGHSWSGLGPAAATTAALATDGHGSPALDACHPVRGPPVRPS
jgi:hypothetical protein